MGLNSRLFLLIALLFGILYGVIVGIGTWSGYGSAVLYIIIAFAFLGIQYLVSPAIVRWVMKIKWVSEKEEPELHQMVAELAKQAHVPKPKVGISQLAIPNACAFGRTQRDGRVCVTRGLLNLLSKDELKAVLGHEISHVKHRLIGLGAFGLYFLTNLLVLYGSRIREYYADLGSVRLGNMPHHLASALYKLVYSNARLRNSQELKRVEGVRAFFVNDPARAWYEIKELSEVDLDMSGTIDYDELMELRQKEVRLSTTRKLMELFSSHPNALKRVKHLSTLVV